MTVDGAACTRTMKPVSSVSRTSYGAASAVSALTRAFVSVARRGFGGGFRLAGKGTTVALPGSAFTIVAVDLVFGMGGALGDLGSALPEVRRGVKNGGYRMTKQARRMT